MDPRHYNLGFAANHSLNAFKNVSNLTQMGPMGGEHGTDTVLRLDSPACLYSHSPAMRGVKRKWTLVDGSLGQVDSLLSLGLWRSASSSESKGSTATACTTMSSAKETEEESSMDLGLDFTLHLGNERNLNSKRAATSSMKSPKVDLELSLSMGHSESDVTSIHQNVSLFTVAAAQNADEGTTSWNRASGFVLDQVQPSGMNLTAPPVLAEHSGSILTPKSSVTCISGMTQNKPHRSSGSKTCLVEGCGKGARGASGRCISHGGGRRCQKPGCHKGAEGRTVYCKAHGGGRRCDFLGCTKSAEGRTDFCIAHGGGRRCNYEGGCTRAARGKSGLCIRHGGGKRCQMEGCTRSAEGLSGLCISHGGGRRCQSAGCTKGAQGSTMYCKAHGGGKRCTYVGCTKGAEGSTPFCKGHGGGKRCAFQGGGSCSKSVHGGTNFCVAHGGGKRCAVTGCTKSARGRTDFCVRHGGGKRCKSEGCGKSAQGSTDFCKAHGGGKRCSWGQTSSGNGSEATAPCISFARGKTGLCGLHDGLVQDNRVHGGITVGPIVQGEEMKEVMASEDMSVDVSDASSFRSQHNSKQYGSNSVEFFVEEASPSSSAAPEGRVHGGSLMAMLAGGLTLGTGSNEDLSGHPLESDTNKSKYAMMPKSWL